MSSPVPAHRIPLPVNSSSSNSGMLTAVSSQAPIPGIHSSSTPTNTSIPVPLVTSVAEVAIKAGVSGAPLPACAAVSSLPLGHSPSPPSSPPSSPSHSPPISLPPPTTISWTDIVQQGSSQIHSSFLPVLKVTHNDDGSASINPSHEFLVKGRKQWDSSIIGHFIGSSYSFKFVKEEAMLKWGNLGLTAVYFSSKGFYTFKFNTVVEKDRALALHVVTIGGKAMYLLPWMEGSNFKKIVISTVPSWIKLVDVPQSYWSREGLGYIAQAVGRPLKLDAATSKMHPMKYAGVQVELNYDAPRPTFVWVPVLDDSDGSPIHVKVAIEYAQLPYSCSICKAFGHSLARCSNNPEVQAAKKKEIYVSAVAAKIGKFHKTLAAKGVLIAKTSLPNVSAGAPYTVSSASTSQTVTSPKTAPFVPTSLTMPSSHVTASLPSAPSAHKSFLPVPTPQIMPKNQKKLRGASSVLGASSAPTLAPDVLLPKKVSLAPLLLPVPPMPFAPMDHPASLAPLAPMDHLALTMLPDYALGDLVLEEGEIHPICVGLPAQASTNEEDTDGFIQVINKKSSKKKSARLSRQAAILKSLQ